MTTNTATVPDDGPQFSIGRAAKVLPLQRGSRERQDARAASLVPSPLDPMAVARHIEPEWTRGGALILRRWRGEWWRWTGSHWVAGTDEEMRSSFYRRMEHAMYLFVDGRSGIESERRWAPTAGKVKNLAEAAAAVTLLPSSIESPGWVDGRAAEGVVIPCRNGLVELATRKLIPPTATYFNTSAVPFDYDPRAPRPRRWLAFLESLWPDDPESIAALQEVMGYTISGRRNLQKIILLVGPKRSGKGTIAAILRALVGPAHTSGPTLAKFSETFGLADLIGKSLAIVPDARMPREGAGAIVEKLLMISGQDSISIPRKHRDDWNGVLSTQLVIMSNELPTLPDAAAAIASRFFILRMIRSFYGQEDTELLDSLMPELPGIFNWTLAGLDRLTERGRFVEPASAAEAAELLSEKSSPITEFLSECCLLDPDATTTEDALWSAWEVWHVANKREYIGTRTKLRTDMFSAAPQVKRARPRTDSPDGKRPWVYVGLRLL